MTPPLASSLPLPLPRAGAGPGRAARPPVRQASVRGQLVLLAASVAAPLILLSGANVWYAYASQRAQQEAALLGRAQSGAAMVDREFEGALSALRVLAASRALARGDLEGFGDEMRQASAAFGGAPVSLVTPTGEVARTTLGPQGARGPGAQAARFVLDALGEGRPAVSDLITGPPPRRATGPQPRRAEVGVALPVPSATPGKPAWMLSLRLPAGRLARDLESLHLPANCLVSIADRQSRIVARSRAQERFLGQRPAPEMVAARARQDAGIVGGGYRTMDGVPTLMAFARAPRSGYFAVIGIPEAEFAAPLRATLLRTAGVAALLTLLGVGGALLLSRRIIGAFRQVTQAAPGTAAPTGLREADALARTIADTDARRRESEARLEMAAEAGGIGIWDWNLPDNSFTYSERARAICGFPAEGPVTYEMVRDATHPDDLPRTSAMCARALDPALRETVPYEYRIVRPDGAVRWVLAQGSAVFAGADGTLRAVRYAGTIQDITGRRQAEQALRDGEARLALAVEAGRMAVWEYEPATDRVIGSPALYRLLGFPEGVTPGAAEIRARYAPGERRRPRVAAEAALARGDRFFEFEHAYKWPDGSLHWLMLRAEFVLRDGVPARVVGVVMDVTGRRRTETELRENAAALRELLATIDLAPVFVREWDGRIRFWSRGCERLYGWSAAEAVGRPAHELLRTVFPVPPAEIEAHLLAHGAWEGDLLHHRRDGTALTMAVRKALRRGADGEPPAVMESVADVTALREAEGKLRALNQHLEARVRAEVAAREAAQAPAAQAERVQALGQLAGGIAHDFNNVLQAVTSGIALIERRAGDIERVRQLARMALDAAARGASVTRRLLVFARRGDLTAEALDPAAVLQGMREILEPTLGGGISVAVAADPGLPKLLADRGQLETALVNLAANARDAMPEGGTVTLGARVETVAETAAGPGHRAGLAPGRYVALTVSDTGTGMDAETLARVTEPFFTTKGPGKGTGLGLAMTRGFAEQSKGGMQVESTPGKGTAVTIWLPAAEAAPGSHPAAPVPEVAPEGVREGVREAVPEAGRSAARVLLVDDDDRVRESLAAGLSDMGHRVQVAPSGEAALALIGTGAPVDCLVTDLSMPGMNGVSLVRAARARRPGLPAIVLTGYAGHEALSGGALAGGDGEEPDYALLWKPADPARIARRIAELLSGEA